MLSSSSAENRSREKVLGSRLSMFYKCTLTYYTARYISVIFTIYAEDRVLFVKPQVLVIYAAHQVPHLVPQRCCTTKVSIRHIIFDDTLLIVQTKFYGMFCFTGLDIERSVHIQRILV